MAKKYHIDAHGKVVPCQAFLRKCPRTDYSSQEAAYSALYIQEEGNRLLEARAEVEKIMSDPNAHSTFISSDFSGNDPRNNTRKFAQKIDKEFFEKGEYPQKVYAVIPLNRQYIDNKTNPITLSLDRIPVADYDEGKIRGEWTLETKIKNHNEVDPIVLDLENNYEEEAERAEAWIRDVVMRTTPDNYPPEYIEYETNHMMNQLEDAFSQIEEEASGPYQIWEKNHDIGTFAGSNIEIINVDVNYNTTLFRGRTFDRFINDEDGYFTSVSPELNIQVYDNENGMSDTSWRLVRYQGDWILQTVSQKDGQPYPQKLENAEDAYNKMHHFVSNYMRTNNPNIAEEKAQYVSELIIEIEQAIDKNRRIKDQRQGKISAEKETTDTKQNHRSLFGQSSNTMDSILDMYA